MSEWISVKDRLPDEHVVVLLASTDIPIFIGRLGSGYFTDDCNDCMVADVTHWQPLPVLPEESDE